MFAIRGVKLNNFETCLLSVAFTIRKVHEFIIQPSYIKCFRINVNASAFHGFASFTSAFKIAKAKPE